MPLKVLNLTSSPHGIGGVETLLLAATDKYDTRRFSVAFCNLFSDCKGTSLFEKALRKRGVAYFDVAGESWRDLPTIVTGLVSLLRRERFDVLHSHMLHATIIGHVAAHIARVPVKIASRQYTGEVFYNKAAWVRALDRYVTRRATHVIAVSKAVRETLIREDKVAANHITVVYNGIDLQSLDSAEVSLPLPWDKSWEDAFLIGCVGNLNNRKGHDDLICALPQILAAQPCVRVVILGEGAERARLEALARELGVADRLLLAGYRKDIPALMRYFDLYVHPSRHEPFGIAIAEAMAARKAVVGTTVGGIPEVLGDGETGILVPPASPNELASAILQLIGDRGLAHDLGERGRHRVEQNFCVEVTVAKYQELYSRFARGDGSR